MISSPSPVGSEAARPQIMYAMEGLPAREELLFKNMVRLLDGTTEQKWVWQPESAEMWVIFSGATMPRTVPSGNGMHCVLALGEPDARAKFHLKLPLRVTELRPLMDIMGNAILAGRAALPQFAGIINLQSNPEHIPVANPSESDEMEGSYRLKSWPRPSLIDTAARLRLATLLVGQPCTVAVLAQRSGVPSADCTRYLQMLKAAGFLESSVVVNSATSVPLAELHLPSAAGATMSIAQTIIPTPATPQNAAAAPQSAKLSLFQRIRNRLSQTLVNNI